MVGPAHIAGATLLPVLSGSSDRAASIAALIVVVLARRGARARCLALISVPVIVLLLLRLVGVLLVDL
jgi:hypothetical protein